MDIELPINNEHFESSYLKLLLDKAARTSNTTLENDEGQNLDYSLQSKDKSTHNLIIKDFQQEVKSYPYQIQRIIKSKIPLKLFADLIITNDGVVRLLEDLSQVSFGYQQGSCHRVEHLLNTGVVNLEISPYIQPGRFSISEVVSLLQKQTDSILHRFSAAIENILNIIHLCRFKFLINTNTEDDLKLYIKVCFEYLRDIYNPNNPNSMYHYQIGRANENTHFDLEIFHKGYSTTYMQFLGIDSQTMSQIFLRDKQIDLISEKTDITLTSLEFFQGRSSFCRTIEVESRITTFDGFKIPIRARRKNIHLQPRSNSFRISNHFFSIIEIDVDVIHLERLIQYRQNLQQNLSLTLEEFLSKELSYFFEDVEYSVRSEEFYDKFYSENISNLTQYMNQLKQKNADVNGQKRCSYRQISNQIPPTQANDHSFELIH